MRKVIKALKWTGLTIAGLICACVFIPWVITTAIGTVIGSLFTSFMTGFSRGTVFTHKVAVGLAYLRSVADSKKIDRKSLALIEAYPGGIDKLLTDYTVKLKNLRTEFIFKHFGADQTTQIEMYLKAKLEEMKQKENDRPNQYN